MYLYGRASPVVMVDPDGMEDVRVSDDDTSIGSVLHQAARIVPITAGPTFIADLAFGENAVGRAAAGSAKQLAERGEGLVKGATMAASLSSGPIGWVTGALSHEGGVEGYFKDAAAVAAGAAAAPIAVPNLLANVGRSLVGIAEGTNAEGVGYHGTSAVLDTADAVNLVAAGIAAEARALAKSVEASAGVGVSPGVAGGGAAGVAAGGEARLVAGGGRAPGFPTLKSGDVSLNIDPAADPHYVADVRATPFADATFGNVKFERLPHDLVTQKSTLFETHRIMKPGGVLDIITGRSASRAALEAALEEAGFTMKTFRQKADTRVRAVR